MRTWGRRSGDSSRLSAWLTVPTIPISTERKPCALRGLSACVDRVSVAQPSCVFCRQPIMSEAESARLDLARPRAWRRWVPSWFRSLVWVDSADKYDAFLSYSWKSDSKAAPVIHSVLQRFLCPWYKLRAKTIFRDLSSLPAGSSLQEELFDRMDRSTHLIVLASPGAAQSGGMELEANHWFSRPRKGQVLIIVTDGEFKSWDEIRDRLLPAAVRTNLGSEPLWTPLQHRRSEILTNPNNQTLHALLVEDLKQVFLRLHAPRTWEELHGQERAQKRRALTIVWTFALVFLSLALAAGGFALYAQRQKNVAVKSAQEAESRSLAVRAEVALNRDRPAALSLAAKAWQTARTTEASTAVADSFPQLLATLQGHNDAIVRAVYSPDGRSIVTASNDTTARVWNAASGQLLANLQGHNNAVLSAVFSPDGQRIVTASRDHTALVWNAASSRLLANLVGHSARVTQAEFSPDGQRIVTASWDRTARVWNAASGQLLATLQDHTGRINSAVFSRDGQRILTVSGDQIAPQVWNASSGQLLATLQDHTGIVRSAEFSHDGQRIVTASRDHTARVWSASSGQLLAILQGHTDIVFSAVFSPDGDRIVTASEDKTARVWNAARAQLVATLQGHTDAVVSAVFSRDGQRIVTASRDHTARVWSASSGQLLAILQGHTDIVSSAVFSPDGQRIVTASWDRTARVWNASTGQLLATLQGHTDYVWSAVFSPDGQRIVTASRDHTASVWNASSGQLLAILQGHTDIVSSAVFSPDGDRIVTASEDRAARVVRLVTLSEIAELLAK